MFAVTGITGQVGGVVARLLLAASHDVRAIVRDAAKGEAWAKQGCEVALADLNDEHALQHAFEGAEGVFILLPPTFDPSPGFPEARKTIAALRAALAAARPSKVVVLSTIGAQATQPNLLNQLQILEQELGTLPMPVAFLRAAWFIENAAWDVAPARDSGIVPSFLQPLDKPVPMVATADIGRVAAELLRESWTGRRIVELEGPQRISPDMIAESFARLLGRDVSMTAVPRDTWEELFRSQGMKNPTPRMQMIDGFNEEWICFEGTENEVRKGRVPLDTVLQSLIEKAS
ncbi:NmrA family transcriptional regulator [Caballeronia mineralivorans PML1(12)]|uniref:NmrA family transcriptional regulator n=1 Tax=Caballeronia mineralivorans PML1(12) TaxID=908627 RepID=A0A0J1CK45_9BURK|nr:NmrA family NAD(P)-binding protein [Caballeronia mineralivorans]KLU20939.1 NmrA family transcriptional regulator [Caballeronia mineralivorans PML1(12)]